MQIAIMLKVRVKILQILIPNNSLINKAFLRKGFVISEIYFNDNYLEVLYWRFT